MIRRCRVLVADPDRGIRRLIQRRVKALGGMVKETAALADTLAIAASWRPDAIVAGMDIDEPRGVRGPAVLHRLRAVSQGAILCLVPQPAGETVPILLDRGADDCLVKPFELSELAVRLHRLLRGNDLAARESLLHGTGLRKFAVLIQAGCVETDRGRMTLSMRELDLVSALIRADGAAVPYADIIEAVWGKGYVGSPHMLHRTVATLRRRIEPVPGTPRLIINVRGIGYRFGNMNSPEEVRF